MKKQILILIIGVLATIFIMKSCEKDLQLPISNEYQLKYNKLFKEHKTTIQYNDSINKAFINKQIQYESQISVLMSSNDVLKQKYRNTLNKYKSSLGVTISVPELIVNCDSLVEDCGRVIMNQDNIILTQEEYIKDQKNQLDLKENVINKQDSIIKDHEVNTRDLMALNNELVLDLNKCNIKRKNANKRTIGALFIGFLSGMLIK